MNIFIDHKIKQFTHKRQQQIFTDDQILAATMRSTINPESLDATIEATSSPRNIKQMKISNFLMRHSRIKEKVVPEPYLKNDKEKIARIITRRLQQEEDYNSLRNVIRNRCSTSPYRKRLMAKPKTEKSIIQPSFINNFPVEQKLEENRYRKRLLMKHEKRSMTIDLS